MKPWIQTYTGKAFNPLEPKPELINISDIAHALSQTCRYTGHSNRFYSVAEHSVYVSHYCDPVDALAGLLHDASEAYLCDIAAPVKQDPIFDGYRAAEKRLERMIFERFGLSPEMPASVKQADTRMLWTEAPQIMAPLRPDWTIAGEPYDLEIEALEPREAERRFLERFVALRSRFGSTPLPMHMEVTQ